MTSERAASTPDHQPATPRLVALPGLPGLPGLVTRHFEPARDYPALAEHLTSVNVHDGHEEVDTAESLRHDWEHRDSIDLDQDVIVAELDGRIIGSAGHDWRQRGERIFHHLHAEVQPAFRGRGLGRALLDWGENRTTTGLASRGIGTALPYPHVLSVWAQPTTPGVQPLLTRAGYSIESYGMMMLRNLADPIADRPMPDGLAVRPVRAEDHRAIWNADVEAFRDHRDPGERTEADYVSAFTDPTMDVSIWQVAWDGEEVAGSVWNTIYSDENEKFNVRRGWLDHISVRRPWRKRGLAAALIVRSLETLRDMGFEEAALGADTENLSGAVRLYESLGFRQHRVHANFVKPIEVPGDARSD